MVEQEPPNPTIESEQIEIGLDREAISRHELQLAAARYSRFRGLALQAAEMDSADHVGSQWMLRNYHLLEPVTNRADANEPDLTICVPVALFVDARETVFAALDQIKRSQDDTGQSLEVILWTNTTYDRQATQSIVTTEANRYYAALRERLHGYDSPKLRIKTALDINPTADGTISKIRANYMDAVAVEAMQRGDSFERPILWLDADTTHINKGAFSTIAAEVRTLASPLVHAELHYTIDWAHDVPLTELDAATKAVAINEIRRRQVARHALSTGVIRDEYL